jgi:hypothetical protein
MREWWISLPEPPLLGPHQQQKAKLLGNLQHRMETHHGGRPLAPQATVLVSRLVAPQQCYTIITNLENHDEQNNR